MKDKYNHSFPFSAVLGQEKARKALLLLAVNPAIGGLLLSGEKGTGKSTMVRGIAKLMGNVPVVDLPLNCTEDRLVGTLDIEKAIQYGKLQLQKGLLMEADGGFLYVDEINLLAKHLVNTLQEVFSSKVNCVEREGISCEHPSSFVLVGSMNPEEGLISSQLLDRFGLYVPICGEREVEQRCEIIKRRLEYENSPKAYCRRWQTEEQDLTAQITRAKALLPEVMLHDNEILFAAGIASAGGCAGHRAELAICETARALAALDGRRTASETDIREAVLYALPHRMRTPIDAIETKPPQQHEKMDKTIEEKPNCFCEEPFDGQDDLLKTQDKKDIITQDNWQDINRNAAQLQLQINALSVEDSGSGKRLKTKSHAVAGRYVRYCLPRNKPKDIAIDATLRAAAMHLPQAGKLMINVQNGDIREKVREHRTGATILFLVDASGSMGVRHRMGAVKGTVLSMLNDAYQKRDTVGVVSFRKDSAEVLLPLTRSVELAEKCLFKMKTGGKTPLAAGLDKASALFRTDRIKNKDSLQYLVLVSDGRANYSLDGKDPLEEAMVSARRIATEGIHALILDVENGVIRFGFAKKLAEAMRSQYIALDKISPHLIEKNISSFLGK